MSKLHISMTRCKQWKEPGLNALFLVLFGSCWVFDYLKSKWKFNPGTGLITVSPSSNDCHRRHSASPPPLIALGSTLLHPIHPHPSIHHPSARPPSPSPRFTRCRKVSVPVEKVLALKCKSGSVSFHSSESRLHCIGSEWTVSKRCIQGPSEIEKEISDVVLRRTLKYWPFCPIIRLN